LTTKFTLVFDCADPDKLAHFWADALGYSIEGPPDGFESWKAFWRSKGVAEKDLEDGSDSIFDPGGAGPRIWFHKMPEGKVVKNRLHLDLHLSGGHSVPIETRKERVNAAAERLVGVGATSLGPMDEEPGVDHYAMEMLDPEGNEFDIN